MIDKNTPAFPTITAPGMYSIGGAQGMTLRDYFAASAKDSDIENYMFESVDLKIPQGKGIKKVMTREQAKFAYADAMLEARDAK